MTEIVKFINFKTHFNQVGKEVDETKGTQQVTTSSKTILKRLGKYLENTDNLKTNIVESLYV